MTSTVLGTRDTYVNGPKEGHSAENGVYTLFRSGRRERECKTLSLHSAFSLSISLPSLSLLAKTIHVPTNALYVPGLR